VNVKIVTAVVIVITIATAVESPILSSRTSSYHVFSFSLTFFFSSLLYSSLLLTSHYFLSFLLIYPRLLSSSHLTSYRHLDTSYHSPGKQMAIPGKIYARYLEPIQAHEASSREEVSRLVRFRMLTVRGRKVVLLLLNCCLAVVVLRSIFHALFFCRIFLPRLLSFSRKYSTYQKYTTHNLLHQHRQKY
jgi:hypothetical protein